MREEYRPCPICGGRMDRKAKGSCRECFLNKVRGIKRVGRPPGIRVERSSKTRI